MKTNKLKVIFAVICAVIIVAGMAVGTVCHFIAGGFFNYGGEFSSYTSVVVTYSDAEYAGDKQIAELRASCDEKLKEFSAYEVSTGVKVTGGEFVYKFSTGVDDEKLAAAVESINSTIDPSDSGLNYAVIHADSYTFVGGAKALVFAAIAISCAIAFQFIYFIFRYKLRSALTALLSGIVNVGVFVSLVAITRIPVGTELIALSAAVVLITMIAGCVFLDRTRKNFKNEAYAGKDRKEVVDLSAGESLKTSLGTVISLAIAVVVLAICAVISLANAVVLAPYGVALLAIATCCFCNILVMPSIHVCMDGMCEKVKNSGNNAALVEKSADKK